MTLFNLNIILLFTNVILYIILLFFIAKQKKRKFNLATTTDFLIFLDQYYISNKYYTFFMCFIYFSITIIPVFVLRYIYLGFDFIITPLTFNFGILITLILLLLIIIIIQTFINLIFKKEIHKFYLFFDSTNTISKISTYISINDLNLTATFAKIVLFAESTARLHVGPADVYDISQFANAYEYIYEKAWIMSLSEFCVYYAKKYNIIRYIFKLLSKIFQWASTHVESDNFFIPSIFFFIFFFYDFCNYKIHYSYYCLFVIYTISIWSKYKKFKQYRSHTMDGKIQFYFYENSSDYKIQRSLLKNNIIYNTENFINKSKENYSLFHNLRDLQTYILNDFKDTDLYSLGLLNRKRYKSLHFKYFIFSILCIMSLYLIFYHKHYHLIFTTLNLKISILFILIFMPVIIYVLPKIFYYNDTTSEFVYNKNYNMIFNIFALVQFIPLILIFYSTGIVMLFSDEFYSFGVFSLKKIYTVMDKQEFARQWLDIYMMEKGYIKIEKELLSGDEDLLYLLKNITNETTLEEIKITMKFYCEFYFQGFNEICWGWKFPIIYEDISERSILSQIINIFLWSLTPKIVISLITKKIYQYSPKMLYRILDKRFLKNLWSIIKAYYER